MLSQLYLLIGIYGLNICCLMAQQPTPDQLYAAGERLKDQARYPEADEQFQAAIRAAEANPFDPAALVVALTGDASVNRLMSRNPQAEALLKRAVSVAEKAFGPSDIRTANTLTTGFELRR